MARVAVLVFMSGCGSDPNRALDATVVNDVLLKVGPGSYAFCIHDFHFLDAAEQIVNPL